MLINQNSNAKLFTIKNVGTKLHIDFANYHGHFCKLPLNAYKDVYTMHLGAPNIIMNMNGKSPQQINHKSKGLSRQYFPQQYLYFKYSKTKIWLTRTFFNAASSSSFCFSRSSISFVNS